MAQEQFLFNMSLLENIRLGCPEATDQRFWPRRRRPSAGSSLPGLRMASTMAGDGGKCSPAGSGSASLWPGRS